MLRLVFGLLLLASIVCFVLSIATPDKARWRRRGLVIAGWTMAAAFGFFAVLILERLAQAH